MPIICVHGMGARPELFWPMRRHLERTRGVRTWAFRYTDGDVPTLARHLAELVEEVRSPEPFSRVQLIGHSLGGIISRYYIQCLGGDIKVHRLVTLSSPHGGTWTAHLAPTARARAIRPGSALLQELDKPWPHGTQLVTLAAQLDLTVHPRSAAHHPGADRRVLPGLSHNGWFMSPRAWRVVAEIVGTGEGAQ